MKVIDLLNKIANGEKPTYIKYDGNIYAYNEIDDFYQANDGKFEFPNLYLRELNEEVEIIEEDKKIYKLDWGEGNTFNRIQENSYLSRKEIELLDSNFKELGNKINEIIDKLNELEK